MCSGSCAHLQSNMGGWRSILRSPHGDLEVTDSLRVQARKRSNKPATGWAAQPAGGERERGGREGERENEKKYFFQGEKKKTCYTSGKT